MIRCSLEEALDLELPLADACGFVPVELSSDYFSIGQSDTGNAFAFAPSSGAMELLQTAYFTNPELVAIVSTPATLPRISKSIDYGSRPLGGSQTRLTSADRCIE